MKEQKDFIESILRSVNVCPEYIEAFVSIMLEKIKDSEVKTLHYIPFITTWMYENGKAAICTRCISIKEYDEKKKERED